MGQPSSETAAYMWPLLLRPAPPAQVIYLDLNHWVDLARAATGHPEGRRFVDALEACRDARLSGRAVFPLSATHYLEMADIGDARRRRDVAGVMEEISGFATLLSRTCILELEVQAVISDRVLTASQPALGIPVVGRGVGWAFGRRGGLRIKSPEGDVTEQVRQRWAGGAEAFDAWVSECELTLERRILAGPTDKEVPELRAHGWNPEMIRQIAEDRAADERTQVQRLDADSRWRRGRLRDVVSAREMAFSIFDIVDETLSRHGVMFSDIWSDRESARRAIDSMPSVDVAVTLKTAAHRNRDKAWVSNDIHDIDALSTAVPYCDMWSLKPTRGMFSTPQGRQGGPALSFYEGWRILQDCCETLVPATTMLPDGPGGLTAS